MLSNKESSTEQVVAEESIQKFNKLSIVERIALPEDERKYDVNLNSKLLFLKNYEIIDVLEMGRYKLNYWRQQIEESDKKLDFFMIYRVNVSKRIMKPGKTEQMITYYDQKIGVNFKFTVEYNFRFIIDDITQFLTNVVHFKNEFTFKDTYKFIRKEFNSYLLSFIANQLLDKDISIIEFNNHSKLFSENYIAYAQKNILKDYGLRITDFNFLKIDFNEDPTFETVSDTLFEKADMKLLNYNYNDKVKYEIIRKILGSNKNNSDVVFVEEDVK